MIVRTLLPLPRYDELHGSFSERSVPQCRILDKSYMQCQFSALKKNVRMRNIEARLRNHCCCGKAVSTTYSECVSVALVNQHAKRMSRIILSSAACLSLLYFSILSHKRYDFQKKKNVILYMHQPSWCNTQI